MGFRFRKSKNFGPLRINFSKSGIGYSVGGKGFRWTKKAGGGTRTTVSLPGTGLSYVRDSGGQHKTPSKSSPAPSPGSTSPRQLPYSATVYRVCSIIAFVVSAVALFFALASFSFSVEAGIVFLIFTLLSVISGVVWHKASLISSKPEPQTSSSAPSNVSLTRVSSVPSVRIPVTIIKNRVTGYFLSNLSYATDYTVLDTETTGLNRLEDLIVEVSTAQVSNCQISAESSTLCNPGIPIPPNASKIHGIFDKDVLECPSSFTVAAETLQSLNNKLVLGYNIAFDLDFLSYSASGSNVGPISLEYIDVMSVAKRAFPGLESYRLEFVAQHLGLSDHQTHRASDDVRLCYAVFEACRSKLKSDRDKELAERRAHRKAIKAQRQTEFSWSPLLDKNFVFTGDFLCDREKLGGMLEQVGANLRSSVNTKTAFLVVGDTSNLPDWALDRKLHVAESLIEKGQDLQIISESEYIDLIEKTISSK